MKIVWTTCALDDLGALRAYITFDNPAAARQRVDLILKTIAGLPRFPESGRSGRYPGTREMVLGKTPYIVIYRTRNATVEIIRLLHSRQKWPVENAE